MRGLPKGFTLIEILVVVLILGILATIVIPQVSTASQDARLSSIRSTLQKARGQIELFKLEHNGLPPQTPAMWTALTAQTSTAETDTPNPVGNRFGPYLQNPPINNWNNLSGVSSGAVDMGAGWYYTCTGAAAELRVRNPDGSVNYEY